MLADSELTTDNEEKSFTPVELQLLNNIPIAKKRKNFLIKIIYTLHNFRLVKIPLNIKYF